MLRALRHLNRVASLGTCATGHTGFATASAVSHMPANQFETPEDIVGALIVVKLGFHPFMTSPLCNLASYAQVRSAPSHGPSGSHDISWTRRFWRTQNPQCR
jgi:hypothetical protein